MHDPFTVDFPLKKWVIFQFANCSVVRKSGSFVLNLEKPCRNSGPQGQNTEHPYGLENTTFFVRVFFHELHDVLPFRKDMSSIFEILHGVICRYIYIYIYVIFFLYIYIYIFIHTLYTLAFFGYVRTASNDSTTDEG